MSTELERNWRRNVRRKIYGVGNVGNPFDIIFFTAQQRIEAERKLKNLEITKNKLIK